MASRQVAVWVLGMACGLYAGEAEAQESPPVPPDTPVEEGRPLPLPPPEPPSLETTLPPGVPTISLAQAVQLSLERNLRLQSSADAVGSARIRESTALAQFYPKITPRFSRSSDESTLTLDASQRLPWTGGSLSTSALFRSSPSTTSPATRSSDLRLLLTQPLLRGFGPTSTFFELTNSRRSRQAQERQFELERQRLAVDVTDAFYQVARQRQLLEVARQSLKRSEGLREASESRLEVGLASKLDVFRAELQASQAEESMVQAQASLETGLERFRVLLGLSPRDPLEPAPVSLPSEPDGNVEPAEVLVARAFENRLDLQETRDQVGDSRRSASVARRNLLPQLDVNLGVTQIGLGPSFGDSLRAGDRRVNLFFTTSYPLERSSEVASRALAELDLTARERTLKQRELEVESEVRGAVRTLERIRKSVALQRKGVEFAEQQRRLATLRYQRGLASNFDVVDAEGSLVSARTALVGLLADYQVARVDLLRVIGTLDVEKEFGLAGEAPVAERGEGGRR